MTLERVLDDFEDFIEVYCATHPIPRGRVDFFITRPSRGGACKRWFMYLKWMNRRDAVDPGTWAQRGKAIPTSALLMPLDTHVGRLSYYLGFLPKESAKITDVHAVTNQLKRVSGNDPTKYDFAISRLGILQLCQRKFEAKICPTCPILKVCRFAQAVQLNDNSRNFKTKPNKTSS